MNSSERKGRIISPDQLMWTPDDPTGAGAWGSILPPPKTRRLSGRRCGSAKPTVFVPGWGAGDQMGNLLYHPFTGQGRAPTLGVQAQEMQKPPGNPGMGDYIPACKHEINDTVQVDFMSAFGGAAAFGFNADAENVDMDIFETQFRAWIESEAGAFNEPEFTVHGQIYRASVVGSAETQEFSIAPAAFQWFACIAVQHNSENYLRDLRVRIGLFEHYQGEEVTNHLTFMGWSAGGDPIGVGADPSGNANVLCVRANEGPDGSRPEQIVRLLVRDEGGPGDFEPEQVTFYMCGAIGGWTCGWE